MATPKEGSRTYAILKMLHEQGPQSFEAVAQRFPTITRKSMGALGSEYKLPRFGAKWGVSAELAGWFNGEPVAVKPIDEIPVTHVQRPFKAMNLQKYFAGMTANKRNAESIRVMKFENASGSTSKVWVD